MQKSNLFILAKEDSLQILNGDNLEWYPPLPKTRPPGMPMVHFLFGGIDNSDPYSNSKDFKRILPKGFGKKHVYVCIPDDYSAVEAKALQDFLYMTGCVKDFYLFHYSASAAIKYSHNDYIAATVTKRCLTVSHVIDGHLIDSNCEYVPLEDAIEHLNTFVDIHSQLPVYLCDPNGLLADFTNTGIEKISLTRDIFTTCVMNLDHAK